MVSFTFQTSFLYTFKERMADKTIKSVMSTLFTERLLTNFNWLGQHGKKSVKDSKVVELISCK